MNKKKLWLSGLLLLILVAAAAFYLYSRSSDAKPAYRFAKVEQGELTGAVSATGTLNPVFSVQVGSQVSGQIKEIFVDYNSVVKKNDVIARIDPDSFSLRVNQALADLESARATALTQRANLAALQADLSRNQVALLETERDLKRNQSLVEKGFVSQAVLEKSQSAVATARENVKTAQAQRAVGEAQVRNGEALVKQREAQLAQARVDLERTYIRAPVDGIVISRSVDAGQTVAASLQAPTLFLIARNLTDMQVEASIDEAEIGRVAVGQTATFTVDSFPGRTFSGQITQVRKAAQVIQNVVTYIAVIAAPNPDQTLLPGMSANVRIVTARRKDVVKIPNAALRYRPANAPASAKPEVKGGTRSGENAKGAETKGGNAQATRERLTKALGLTEEQQAKLEAIQRDTRQKIAGIVADTPAARKREIGRLRAESRGRISEMLTAEQRAKYEAIIAEQQGITARRGTVWQVDGQGNPKAVAVRLGISDGSYTELIGKELKAGDQLIIGAAGPGGSRGGGATKGGPRFGF